MTRSVCDGKTADRAVYLQSDWYKSSQSVTDVTTDIVQQMLITTRRLALNSGANSNQPLDCLHYVFALCDPVTLTFDLLTPY